MGNQKEYTKRIITNHWTESERVLFLENTILVATNSGWFSSRVSLNRGKLFSTHCAANWNGSGKTGYVTLFKFCAQDLGVGNKCHVLAASHSVSASRRGGGLAKNRIEWIIYHLWYLYRTDLIIPHLGNNDGLTLTGICNTIQPLGSLPSTFPVLLVEKSAHHQNRHPEALIDDVSSARATTPYGQMYHK